MDIHLTYGVKPTQRELDLAELRKAADQTALAVVRKLVKMFLTILFLVASMVMGFISKDQTQFGSITLAFVYTTLTVFWVWDTWDDLVMYLKRSQAAEKKWTVPSQK